MILPGSSSAELDRLERMGFAYQVLPEQCIHIDFQLAHKVELMRSPDAREILLKEISYEGRFASGVLPNQQDHRPGIKIGLIEGRRDKLVEVVSLQITMLVKLSAWMLESTSSRGSSLPL